MMQHLRWFAILLCLPMLSVLACPSPPVPEQDLKANSFYSDPSGSIVDEDKLERYKADAAPVDNFLRKVTQMASAFQSGDTAAGRCTMIWLTHWADGDALLGQAIGGSQAEFLRKWTLAGLSVAYLKVQTVATPAERRKIARWFPAIAEFGLAVFRDPRHKKNNHYYWVGLAVLGAGIAANDSKLIDAARHIYDKALDDIEDDGTLPLEMARAGRALHYHNYAMEPLVMMAEEAKLLGENWYTRKNRRLDLLANRIVAGLADPQWFAARTGKEQEVPQGNQLGWMLLYRKVATDPKKFDAWLPTGEVQDSRLGGSLTRLAEKGFPPQS
ncbi:MAG: alginate lyase family protein [Formivibrio sp.]|nr:alginate lyase family protein [Formivibrio sp.]